jgi:hypothetical protein
VVWCRRKGLQTLPWGGLRLGPGRAGRVPRLAARNGTAAREESKQAGCIGAFRKCVSWYPNFWMSGRKEAGSGSSCLRFHYYLFWERKGAWKPTNCTIFVVIHVYFRGTEW